mgnify:CR=1 FL=1
MILGHFIALVALAPNTGEAKYQSIIAVHKNPIALSNIQMNVIVRNL